MMTQPEKAGLAVVDGTNEHALLQKGVEGSRNRFRWMHSFGRALITLAVR